MMNDDSVGGSVSEISSVLAWVKSLIRSSTGNVKPCQVNAAVILANHHDTRGRVRLNTFKHQIEVSWAAGQTGGDVVPWRSIKDTDVTRLIGLFDPMVSFTPDMMFSALRTTAEASSVNPVQEYLRSVQWDGVARADTLFTRYFGAEDSPLHREIGLRFLISAVARALRPGCKVDTLPVLEGKQGVLKSQGVAALVPDRSWFRDTAFDLNSKDAYQALHGVWIYEIGELHSFTRADTTRLKNFLSSQEDSFRPPYGRNVETHQRQTVFVGTTNEKDYVTDHTGERRKWPVPVGTIDLDALKSDRDQLWAEAVAKFDVGERWYLNTEDAAAMSEVAMDRMPTDPMYEAVAATLQHLLQKATSGDKPVPTHFLVSDIFLDLGLDAQHTNSPEQRRVYRALGLLGLTSKRRKVKGVLRAAWDLPPKVAEGLLSGK